MNSLSNEASLTLNRPGFLQIGMVGGGGGGRFCTPQQFLLELSNSFEIWLVDSTW